MRDEIWVIAAKRTPFGSLNGTLKGMTATDLATVAAEAALAQSGLGAKDIDHVILGNVLQTSRDAAYAARHVGLRCGLPIETPALVVNRLCGSGFQSVVTGCQQILSGESKAVLALGTENMTQAPHVMYGLREGQRFAKPPKVFDSLWEVLTDAHGNTPMGITAENLAAKYGIGREEVDAFALRSQKLWQHAQESGALADELAPVAVKSRRGEVTFEVDEHPRPDTTADALAKLKPAFSEDGVVTAGNASGISDGAGALVVAQGEWAQARGLRPLAKVLGWGIAGVEPTMMGIGPVPAIDKALAHAGVSQGDVDLFDVNEAFAAQFLAVQKALKLPEERTNVNGGAIALGHPLGATGSRILANVIYTLRKRGLSLGVGAACIGGGQGIAVVLQSM